MSVDHQTSSYTPQPVDYSQAETHSSLVRLLRVMLPILALVIAGVVMGRLMFQKDGLKNIDTVTAAEKQMINEGMTEMKKPAFSGIDLQNRPFHILASRAYRSTDQAHLLDLDNPMADIKLKDQHLLAVSSEKGVYNEKTQMLHLNGAAKLLRDDGYVLETDKMQVDLQQSVLRSDDKVRGIGPTGHIIAKGLYAEMQEGYIRFEGPATLTLLPASGK